jgi:hypothetical protein
MSTRNTRRKDQGEKKPRGMWSLSLLIVCLGMAFIIQSAFVFLVIGVLPSIVAYYTHAKHERQVFRIVLCCNLAGLIPYMAELLESGNNKALLQEYIADPRVWLVVYLSAGAGYLLVRCTRYVVQFVIEFTSATKIARLQGFQNRLLEEWGPEVQRMRTEPAQKSASPKK